MICVWSCWCHCHPIISCSSKIQNGLPFWCRFMQVVMEKRLLNGCSSSSSSVNVNNIAFSEVLAWLSVWSKVHMICMLSSWCHCHPSSLASLKFKIILSFCYRLTQAVLEKRLLNGCSFVCLTLIISLLLFTVTCKIVSLSNRSSTQRSCFDNWTLRAV